MKKLPEGGPEMTTGYDFVGKGAVSAYGMP
jgi:hypothetical protein